MTTIWLCRFARLWPLLLCACSPQADVSFGGYAEGEYVRLAAPLSGTLVQLSVRRGDQARQGAPAYVLEHASESAARTEAHSRVARAESLLADLQKGARSDELAAIAAELQAAQASLALSRATLTRDRQLLRERFIAPARVDASTAAVAADQARVDGVGARLRSGKAGARSDQIAAAGREVDAARAQLAQAAWRVDQKAQLLPVGGLVTDVIYRVGEFVPAGAPIVSVLPAANLKARFFVPERRLGELRVGQAVSIACDGCAAPIKARISFISPEAEFTAPLIYSNENRANLVFMMEALPEPGQQALLHPGQPLTVTAAGLKP